MKQNITLSLDKNLLAELKVIAARRSMSISRMLSDELTEIVKKTRNYEQARRYALTAMENGFHGGGYRVSRDELHER